MLVLVSHEGTTPLTIEAAKAFPGEKWLVTAKHESELAALCDEVLVVTPAVEESYCHTASYTCAVAALAALRGEDVSWLPAAVAERLDGERLPVSEHERWLFAGAGRDWPTAQEATLKLREGAYLAAQALPARGASARSSRRRRRERPLLRVGGRGSCRRARRRSGRARCVSSAATSTLVPTRHPVVDIVPFQLLTLDLAADRGVDPDLIRWDDPRWKRARDSYA